MSILDDGDGARDSLPDPRDRLAGGEPIDAAELIEMLCSDQVDRWRAGERIPAEAYMALHPTLRGGGEAAFELIYGEFLIRESLGEPPKIEEFCWRFPHFADRLRRQLGLHHALGEAAPKTERGLGDSDGLDPADGLAVPLVPGFEIVGVLGQGGMSVVYLARQVGADRLVALKVIRATGVCRPRRRRSLPRRGRGRRPLPAPQHHPGVRGRRVRRTGLPGPGIRFGRQPPAEARGQSPAAPRRRTTRRAPGAAPSITPTSTRSSTAT